jgi:hypothetical protein
MKFKYIAAMLGVFALSTFVMLSASAKLGVEEITSEEYILNHGHSKEISRMIKQQERTITAEEPNVVQNGRFKKIWKNLFYERDLTLPTKDLGRNVISTPEAPDR